MNIKDIIFAIRHLSRYKKYSILNILGLALGMASAMIIILWVLHQLKVDKFHEHGDNIYMMRKMVKYSDGKISMGIAMSALTAPAIKEELPEIEEAVRVTWEQNLPFRVGEIKFYEKGYYVDSNFFDVFTYPLLLGNKENVLTNPNAIVISEKLAIKYFGNTNVIGKSINVCGYKDEVFNITGVIKNVTKLSSLEFEYLMPFSKYYEYNKSWISWDNHHLMTFIKVTPNSDIELLGKKITDVYLKNSPWQLPRIFLQPFEDVFLYKVYENSMYNPTGLILYVRIFSAVALFIIFLASMNYTNMATAITTKRSKEVGIKKVFGSNTLKLMKQFTLEALALTGIGFILSIFLVQLSLPYFNVLLNTELKLNLFDKNVFGLFLLVPVLTGILSGTFPALYLSSFKPIVALKNIRNHRLGVFNLRQSMVVFQFVITIVFIISSLLILKQVKYIQNKLLGADRANVVMFQQNINIIEHREVFKQELVKQPGVLSVSYAADSPFRISSNTSGVSWRGKNPNESYSVAHIRIDHDFCKTFNMEIVEGRDLSVENSTDKNGVLINQQFARLMGFEEAAGEKLNFWGESAKIIGVVKDFHSNNFHEPISPLIMICRPYETWLAMVKIDGSQKKGALKNIKKVFSDFNENIPFEYEFIEDQFKTDYEAEIYLSQFSNIFTILAIIISCLGLFGLALFTTEQKTKEIGIRKSIGAKTSEVVFMIAERFIQWIVIAFIIASSIAYYMMEKWLDTFAYRTELSWWIFILTGVIVIIIGLVTFSWQAYRAASQNPVEALRYE